MYRRSNQNQNMKDLMTRSPDIERPWAESFGNSASVEAGSNNVQQTLSKDMRKTDRAVHLGDAEDDDAVENGDSC